jgi:hypothetical protein
LPVFKYDTARRISSPEPGLAMNPSASLRAISSRSWSRRMLPIRKAGSPACLVPKNSPGPRSFKSISAM